MMPTVNGSAAGREPDHEASRQDDDVSLLSTRTLVIISVAGFVGMLAGISAGVAAGIEATQSAGLVTGVILGLAAGFVAAVVTGGAVAATLHVLVGRSG
jgi:uncharacterized membrane-anchored protein